MAGATGAGAGAAPCSACGFAGAAAAPGEPFLFAEVARRLAERFPQDGLMGEEGLADRPSASGITWAVDPIDGTWNFAAGIPHWCVVVACADHDGPLVGVTVDPLRGETWSAVRGGGALLLDGEPVERPVREAGEALTDRVDHDPVDA